MTFPTATVLGDRIGRALKPPSAGDVHIWSGSITDASRDAARLDGVLSPDERDRVARFATAPLRARATLCRGLLRHLLGAYLGRAPAALDIVHGANGKPYLSGDALSFNLAHTDTRLSIAIAGAGRAVGVDVEALDRPVSAPDIARRFFHEREWNHLGPRLAAGDSRSFFTLWTAKEAFIKATGEGLSRDLSSFCVLLDPPRLADPGEGTWSFVPFAPDPRHVGMVALDHPAPVVSEARLWG